MADKVSTVAELQTRLGESFQADKTSGMDTVFQFDLSGDNGGAFWLHVQDGAFTNGDGVHDNPSLTINATADDFIKVVNGDLAVMSAFMGGKIKIKGDMGLAMKLQTIFPFG